MLAGVSFLPPKEFLDSPALRARHWSLEEAYAYTRWLATAHYENFHVVSLLLPARLHQDFFNIYAFCRWADDLGDELGDTGRSLDCLAGWRSQVFDVYAGKATHPVFVALRSTLDRHRLPQQLFLDLIHAFEVDQRVWRFRDWDRLFDYCVCSANPVGRLILHLCGYFDEERCRLSDFTCTALQLANFWQDVTVDWQKNRVYIPLEVLYAHGSSIGDIRERRATPEFRAALAGCVAKAQDLFEQGLPLARMLSPRVSLDVDLFSRGGMKVLDKIRALDYDVLRERPVVTKSERLGLLLGGIARVARSLAA